MVGNWVNWFIFFVVAKVDGILSLNNTVSTQSLWSGLVDMHIANFNANPDDDDNDYFTENFVNFYVVNMVVRTHTYIYIRKRFVKEFLCDT